MPRNESDIDTEKIERAMRDVMRGGDHPPECRQEHRIAKCESRLDDHDRELTEGSKQFVRLEEGLKNVAEKVGTLNKILAAVGGTIGLGLLGTAGAALLYTITKMPTA